MARLPGDLVGCADFGSKEAGLAAVERLSHAPASPTILAFAGIAQGFTMPKAEFSRTLAPYDVNVLFVKDLANCSYQQGLPGLASTAGEAAAALRDLLGSAQLLGTIGVSVGGLAAVMYGHLLQAPRVLAFGPRIRLTPEGTAARRRRDPDYPAPTYGASTSDMSVLLSEGTHCRMDIHVAAHNRYDMRQAALVAAVPGVVIVEHPTEQHGVAGWLRGMGRLDMLVAEGFGLRPR